ncbi:hypothetical protein AMECASPLE_039845 [Ameca splendens]|uniref:Uncharacterized protein n=1 Tax=Ameca splendens TaxID=208324 RepID=A0ABV0YK04_9TELE
MLIFTSLSSRNTANNCVSLIRGSHINSTACRLVSLSPHARSPNVWRRVGAAALGRDEDPLLSGRPAFAGSVQRGSGGTDKEAGRTSDSPGVFHKLAEKFGFPIPDDRLSGGGVKLSLLKQMCQKQHIFSVIFLTHLL